MFTTPAAIAIKIIVALAFLFCVGLLLFGPREPASAQEASTVGNSIHVFIDTQEEDDDAEFEICLVKPDETVCHDYADDGERDERFFDDLENGRYELHVVSIEDGWRIDSFRCSPSRHDDLRVETSWARFGLTGDGDHFRCTITFEEIPPTATPTATKTPTPAPTSTAVPVPTQAPPTILVACPGSTALVNLTTGQTCPTAPAPTAAPPVVQPVSVITPPNTGDAGLLEVK